MAAALPPASPARRRLAHWAMTVAALLAAAVALILAAGIIPPVREFWVTTAQGGEAAVPALWAAAAGNMVAAVLLGIAIARCWTERRLLRWLLMLLAVGALVQALALLDASAADAIGGGGPQLARATVLLRVSAAGDGTAGLLMLYATLPPPRHLLRRLSGRTPRKVVTSLLGTWAFLVLLSAGPAVAAAVATSLLLLAGILAARGRLPGMPATRAGRWSVLLLGGFAGCFTMFLWAVALGMRGGDTFFSNPFLALIMLAAGVMAIAGGALAAVAVVRQRERSSLTIAALVLGSVATVFALGELLAPH